MNEGIFDFRFASAMAHAVAASRQRAAVTRLEECSAMTRRRYSEEQLSNRDSSPEREQIANLKY